jgi:hypothetical protein
MEGVLTVEENKRYRCVLEDYILAVYNTEDLVRVVPITEDSEIAEIAEKRFSIGGGFVASAETKQERDLWVQKLKETVQRPKQIRAFFKAFKCAEKQLDGLKSEKEWLKLEIEEVKKRLDDRIKQEILKRFDVDIEKLTEENQRLEMQIVELEK